jgi:VanZ family protein
MGHVPVSGVSVGRTLSLWAPVGAWMIALFVASAQSDIGVAARIPDWITHGAAYFVLGLLVSRASAGGAGGRLSRGDAVVVVLLCTLYGVSDEIHQAFVPGRDASTWDVAKDLAGAAAATVVWRLAWPRRDVTSANGDRTE